MALPHPRNQNYLQSLLPLTKTREDLFDSHGSLWADENSAEGTRRCLVHMYGKKKTPRGSILHRFIIKGETWKRFKQVPARFVAAANGKPAHLFYTAYEPIPLNNPDILHQAFNRKGIIHGPQRIGTVEEARQVAADNNEYDSIPNEYAKLFDTIPLKSPNLSPRKRPRVGSGIVPTEPMTQDSDSSGSDTF